MIHIVYFELYGKKLKAEVEASSEEEARQKIINRLKFHKIVKKEDEVLEFLKKTFFK